MPNLVIDTDLFRVTFSNQGANVRSWQLKKYRGNDGKPLELVNTAAFGQSGSAVLALLLRPETAHRRQSRLLSADGRCRWA